MATSPQSLRAAVVGLGRMGLRHIEVLNGLQIPVAGVADRQAEAVVAGLAQCTAPGAVGLDDGVAMLEQVRPDLVVIATTAPSHALLVKAAVEAGARYVLCEKPIAVSLTEADEMIAFCKARGATLAVNHQMRFMPNYTEVKALLDTPELGALTSMVVTGSNFGLAMNGSHYFEAFRWLCDRPVEWVSAWLEPDILANPRGPEFEDRSGRVLAANGEGQTLYIDASGKSGWGLNVTYICRNGQIMVDELSGEMRIVAREAEYRALPTARYGMPVTRRVVQIPPVDAVTPTAALWRSMLSGGDFPTGGAGMDAIRCLAAAHLSDSRGGQRVALGDTSEIAAHRFSWA